MNEQVAIQIINTVNNFRITGFQAQAWFILRLCQYIVNKQGFIRTSRINPQ